MEIVVGRARSENAPSRQRRGVFALATARSFFRRATGRLNGITQASPSPGDLVTALVVAVAYYLGAELAFWIGTLSYFFAPLWPPNMILFAALLQAPYRAWWLYVAAAFPAHVAAEMGMGMQALPLLGAFACNIALALISAAGLRRLSAGPPWIDSLAKAWTFIIVAVVGAPVLVACGIAALGRLTDGEVGGAEFAARWGTANILGGIALAPIFVTWIGEGLDWLRHIPVRRGVEAACLTTALGVSAFIGFPATSAEYPVLACVPVPLMVWAAVRFGPRGASGAILVVTLMALVGAIEGRAPFAASSPEHTILSLQLFLAVLSAPFLVLAAVVTEFRRAQHEVQDLNARLLRAQDEEQRRIARELHDGTAQTLAGATLSLSRALSDATPANKMRAAVEESMTLLNQAGSEIRTLSFLLHPPMLDELGLVPALRTYINGFTERANVDVKLQLSPDLGRIDPTIEIALFRIVQESLANVHRHSGSSTAEIRLEPHPPDKLILTVSDTGRGILSDASSRAGDQIRSLGVGIPGMKSRLKQLGGKLDIRSGASGTTLTAVVPRYAPIQ